MVEFQGEKLIFIAIVIALTIVIVLTFFLLALYKYYKRAAQQQLEIQKAILQNQENERIRIAKELHDGIGIVISSIGMQTNNINDSETHQEAIQAAQRVFSLVDKARIELREIVYNLSPYNLEKNGLQAELSELKFFATKQNLTIDIDFQTKLDFINLNCQILIYRILQELLNNTIKYAKASQISISFSLKNNQLIILYADNGIGLSNAKTSGYGLQTIDFRTKIMNGTYKMTSPPNKGLEFEFIFNIKNIS